MFINNRRKRRKKENFVPKRKFNFPIDNIGDIINFIKNAKTFLKLYTLSKRIKSFIDGRSDVTSNIQFIFNFDEHGNIIKNFSKKKICYPFVTTIIIKSKKINEEDIENFDSIFPNIKNLDISHIFINNNAFEYLTFLFNNGQKTKFINLKMIGCLSHKKITIDENDPILGHYINDKIEINVNTDIIDFRFLNGLKNIDISNNDNINDNCFVNLKSIEELKMANLGIYKISDNAFFYLDNLKKLDVSRCTQLTDDFFTYIKNVTHLTMNNCNQKGLTNKGLNKLVNLEYLSMKNCHSPSIDDSGFENFQKLKYLNISGFLMNKLTCLMFKNFKSLKTLEMTYFNQKLMTNKAFFYLKGLRNLAITCSLDTENLTELLFTFVVGIQYLNISNCRRITTKAFKYFVGIKTLIMDYCNQKTIDSDAFIYLVGIKKLSMIDCNQKTITDSAFRHISSVTWLDVSGCNQLTDDAFETLKNLEFFSMAGCKQDKITNKTLKYVSSAKYLDISYCNQNKITNEGFAYLSNVKYLRMCNCDQEEIDEFAYQLLENIKYLNIRGCNLKSITSNTISFFKTIKYFFSDLSSKDIQEKFDFDKIKLFLNKYNEIKFLMYK